MLNMYNKLKNTSPAAKASIAFLISNVIVKGISLLSGPVFTRMMSSNQYGIVSTFLSWQNLLSVIVTLNLSQGIFNTGMLEHKKDRDTFQYSLLMDNMCLSILFLIVYLLFRKRITSLLELPDVLVYFMIAYFFTFPAYLFWSGKQRYEYKYKALTLVTIGMATISVLLGIVAVFFAPDSKDAVARICTMEGINIIVGIYCSILIGIKSKFKFNIRYCIDALKFNIPLLPHYLSMYVLGSSDRIMITKMVNASATAIYSVAYTVASVITIVWQAIEASLTPWIYEKLSVNEKKPIRSLTTKILLFFAATCLLCTLFAPEIIIILAPSEYYSGIFVIPSVAAGVFFTAIYSLYMRIELFYKQTSFAPIATTVAAILNIGLNYIFIKQYGFLAAGYTTMVCYALLALLHYMNTKKKGYADIFNNTLFLLISLSVIIVSLVIISIYDYIVLRYIFIFVIILVIIIKRKKIMLLIRNRD